MKNGKDNGEKVLYMPIFMSIGISIGVAIGAAIGNIPVCMCMGVCIGVCLGAGLDAYNKNKSDKHMTFHEREALDQYYKDYKKIGGNSYIDKYYNRMSVWTVGDDDIDI